MRYKPGDVVIRKDGSGKPFKVHMYSEEGFAVANNQGRAISFSFSPGVCDVHLNWVKADDVILAAVKDSKLFKLLNEKKDEV